MHDIRDLADRIERLVLRHEELERTNALLRQELTVLVAERDGLRARLHAARARIEVLLERLPRETSDTGRRPA
jgi:cell division protein ZapB